MKLFKTQKKCFEIAVLNNFCTYKIAFHLMNKIFYKLLNFTFIKIAKKNTVQKIFV